MKSVIIIPARMDSVRFPGKPFADCGGVPLLQRTVDAAKQTQAIAVVVASPDREICAYCRSVGIAWKPTSEDHPTGTHRCAEAAERINEEVDVIVNWQVDEPLVNPQHVDSLIYSRLHRDRNDLKDSESIATAVAPIDELQAHDRDVVKTIVLPGSGQPYCRWFSRASMQGAYGHIGVYAFSRQTLIKLGKIEPTPLAELESLEQLAWIENEKTILAFNAGEMPQGVNTQTDLDKVIEHYENQITPLVAD